MRLSKESIRHGSQASHELLETLRNEAGALGLSCMGVADARCLPDAHQLEAWLERGYHAGMEYMGRLRAMRLNPEYFFPGTQSILCVAVNYYVSDHEVDAAPSAADQTRPKVAHYARGCDYHNVLRSKLHLLLQRIQAVVPGIRGRVAVDTAPVLERYWAAQAGLGWIGRNGLLIVPSVGSWVFLGEVFLDVPLPPGRPIPNRCGSCDRCLNACPTEALTRTHGLDAGRCIAYWTVEHKGAFPPEAPPISPWLFGCDACQEVCPWNRSAPETTEPAFEPVWTNGPQSLGDWRRVDEREFDQYLAQTAMERAGFEGLTRNLCRLTDEHTRAS
ncbi:MAG: tRNA epoxyqueuosine(34) reductase QueG [Candidatus Eisenbacteria sp.]|nr:tRNA epoxyqueuosine(34) reductase QueG [Candidatus Eisenbacteria bacterium]